MTQTLLLLAALTVGAPAPAPRPPAPQEIGPGHYRHLWGGSSWAMHLTEQGDYLVVNNFGQRWEGSYSWDAAKRLLTVCESPDLGQTWYRWSVTLDADGRGVTQGDMVATVRIWREPKGR